MAAVDALILSKPCYHKEDLRQGAFILSMKSSNDNQQKKRIKGSLMENGYKQMFLLSIYAIQEELGRRC